MRAVTDYQRVRRLNKAAQKKYSESTLEPYEVVWDRFRRAQEGHDQLSRSLLKDSLHT